MDDKNPLQVCPLKSTVDKDNVTNKRGRPTMGNIIKFGPQPESIVAQMLKEMITDSKEPVIDNDQELTNQSFEPEEFTVADIVEEHIYDLSSHRSNDVKEQSKHYTKYHQFICDFPNCSYSCKLSSNLIKHKRVHTNEKPYLCDRCSFRSNFINSLKVHKRTHTAEKPYHCKQCSYKCNSSSNLKKHCQIRHPNSHNCKYK